jgi:hypothetical protein
MLLEGNKNFKLCGACQRVSLLQISFDKVSKQISCIGFKPYIYIYIYRHVRYITRVL